MSLPQRLLRWFLHNWDFFFPQLHVGLPYCLASNKITIIPHRPSKWTQKIFYEQCPQLAPILGNISVHLKWASDICVNTPSGLTPWCAVSLSGAPPCKLKCLLPIVFIKFRCLTMPTEPWCSLSSCSFLQHVFAQSQLWPQLFDCVQRAPPLTACSPRHRGRGGGKEPMFPTPFPSKTLSAWPFPKVTCSPGTAFRCPSAKENIHNTSTQWLIYPSLLLPDYRWAFSFNHYFSGWWQFLLYVYERSVCVCDRMYVFCVHDSSVTSQISASGHPSMGTEGRPACEWDPKAIDHILKVTRIYLYIKKANKLYFFGLSVHLYKPVSISGWLFKQTCTGNRGQRAWPPAVTWPWPFQVCILPSQPHLMRNLLRSPRSHRAAAGGLLQSCWPQACTAFAQLLP